MADLRALIRGNRFRAHEVFFRHRHEYPFAPFHRDLVADFWSDERYYIDFGFRECGKTTLVEEAIVIAACEGSCRNCLIVGAKEALACELLANVKAELENNDDLLAAYPAVRRGDVWRETKITLASGYCIQAVGRDQSLRGTKHRDWRPDLVVVNDFEDDDDVLTPEGRRRTMRWVLKVLLPACDRQRRKVRIYDTVRDAESVPMQLHKQGWPARFIPVSYLDEAGDERPSWPGHPTMTAAWLASERGLYARLGELDIWEREYMCSAASQADRTFNAEHFKVEAVPRTWQAVYAMIDPARSTNKRSATTGWAVWSWVRNRLVVWESGARGLKPDEIIDLAFRIARAYSPVEIGVEEDGLNEWLSQPLRARMLKDGVIPYRGMRAPRGKIDFIRGLQPFAAAGEIVFAAEMPDLREQLLSFPTGRIDAPNALAYALLMRPGRLIYEGWNPNVHIDAAVEPAWGRPVYLVANATRSALAASLAQYCDGRIVVFEDWFSEGDAGQALENIAREASLRTGGERLTLIAGRKHWDQYQNVGLIQASRAIGLECRPGGDPARGRELIRRELSRSAIHGPSLVVSPAARWTLNAFAGGYGRPLRDGNLVEEAADNHYRLLMEGFESFAGLLAFGLDDDETEPNYAIAADGRRYRSALPSRMQMRQ